MRYEFCLSIGDATLERQIRERLKTDNLKVGVRVSGGDLSASPRSTDRGGSRENPKSPQSNSLLPFFLPKERKCPSRHE